MGMTTLGSWLTVFIYVSFLDGDVCFYVFLAILAKINLSLTHKFTEALNSKKSQILLERW